MDLAKSASSERGFSLVETIVSIGLLTTVAIGVAQLFAVSTLANLRANGATSTALLATQKMEQLRGLTWGFGDQTTRGLPITDTTTNLATDPPGDNGRGLSASPASSLHRTAAGYVDYLDADGRWVGTGSGPPAGTYYVRRWSVQPLPENPNNTLVLQVRVVTLSSDLRATPSAPGPRVSDETRLVDIKTRKSP